MLGASLECRFVGAADMIDDDDDEDPTDVAGVALAANSLPEAEVEGKNGGGVRNLFACEGGEDDGLARLDRVFDGAAFIEVFRVS